MIASPARYSLLGALVLAGLAVLAGEGTRLGLLPALLLVPLVAWPAWLGLAYAAAVRRIEARSSLREGEAPWWAVFLGGALGRQVAAIPLALLAAGSAGWMLVAGGWAGLLWIAATAVVLYPVAALLSRPLGPLRPYARLRPVLLLAPPIAAALLTAAWLGVEGVAALGDANLAERVAAEPRYEGSSAILAWAVDGMALLNGARAWGMAWAQGQVGPVAALWQVGGAYGQFWLLAGAFAGCLLPQGEARRILRPSATDEPAAVGAPRAALAGFLAAILGAALLPLLAEAEAWAAARQHPTALAEAPGLTLPAGSDAGPSLAPATDTPPATLAPLLPTPTALRRIVEAEQIGDLACPEGTIAGIEAIDRTLQDLRARRRDEVEAAARAGFDAVRAQVPVFLDNYYSLTAEYVRTFHLVAGEAESFLGDELAETLDVEGAFAPFRTAVAGVEAPLPPEALARRDRLLQDCGILPSDGEVLRVTATRPESLIAPAPDVETVGLRTRLAAGGIGTVAGGIAGVVAGKIIAKLLAKEAFGLAAEAVAKLAMAKAAGGLGGAAAGAGAGALAGSVVPGIGTTVGAAIGGVLGGLALGVATDYALIRVEEAVSRDEFEAEIRLAIDEAETELLGQMLPPQ